MLRKSVKYVLIASVNVCLLLVLSVRGTGDLRLVGDSSRLAELMEVFFLFCGTLIAMRIMVGTIRKKSIALSWKRKARYAVLLTLLISGYYYLSYGVNIHDRYTNAVRQSLASKIESLKMLDYGSKAEALTYTEYEVLRRWKNFSEISSLAENISYKYSYDGFLPDYIFQLNYEVPLDVEIETINQAQVQFSRSQNFEIVGNRKVVSYSEGRS